MTRKFLHTADIHLGKTYRTSTGEAERYEDFFRMLGSIVSDAIAEQVDFVLIAGDLFHTGQILPRTFARTIETLQPLKDAGIPCIAVEGKLLPKKTRHDSPTSSSSTTDSKVERMASSERIR